jgi:hypothetical protein
MYTLQTPQKRLLIFHTRNFQPISEPTRNPIQNPTMNPILALFAFTALSACLVEAGGKMNNMDMYSYM